MRPVVPPDSGLQLLVSGSGALRWAPDPDAPALRPLTEGELRLTIRCFELGPADVGRFPRARAWQRGAACDAWQALPAYGLAEVTESRVPGCRLGAMVRGPLRVGTHLVLRGIRHDGAGFDASIGEGTAGATWRYGWWSDGVSGCDVGPEAVEQAIAALRDGSHGTAPPGLLSLSPVSSSIARGAPINVASCPRPTPSSRRPDSSIGRLGT